MKILEKIETERLLIRPFVLEDFDAFWSFIGDPEATRYMAFTDEQKTYESAKAMLEMVIASYDGDEPVCALAMTDRCQVITSALVGCRRLSSLVKSSATTRFYLGTGARDTPPRRHKPS